MTTKLFIASLPFEYTDEQLEELFKAVGPVSSAKMVMDRKHGRTRGFGFVTMSTETDAQLAVEKLNGSSVGERKIWVTAARPETERTEEGDRPNIGNKRFERPRHAREGGPRPFGGRPRNDRGDRPPRRDGFDALFPGNTEGDSQPRRPFGRSGRGVDNFGNPSYFGAPKPPSSAPRTGGSWRPRNNAEGGRPERPFSGGSRGGRPFGRFSGEGYRGSSDRPSSGGGYRGSFDRPSSGGYRGSSDRPSTGGGYRGSSDRPGGSRPSSGGRRPSSGRPFGGPRPEGFRGRPQGRAPRQPPH